MTPLDYVNALRRRWRVVAACFVLAAAVGFILTPAQSAMPSTSGVKATVTLLPTTNGANLNLAASLATTNDVALLAADQLEETDASALAVSVEASADTQVGTVTIIAVAADPKRAAAVAEAFATATVDFLRTAAFGGRNEAAATAMKQLTEVKVRIAELEREIADDGDNEALRDQVDAEVSRYGSTYSRLKGLVVPEDAPLSFQMLGTPQLSEFSSDAGISAPTSRSARALLAGLLGLGLGLAVALVIDRLDTRLREREEIEDAFGLPVLAEIPRRRRAKRVDHTVVMATRPDSPAAEAYRSLRSAVLHLALSRQDGTRPNGRVLEKAPQVIVVAGTADEGKSSTVANLASALAEAGRSVLVLDCDFRSPEAHLFLDAPPGLGLADLVDTDIGGGLDQVIRPTAVRNVSLVTAGGAGSHPAGVLLRLSWIIAEARKRADIVLVDSGPLLATSDAADLLQHADAALVTCRTARMTPEQAGRVQLLLQRADVPLLGVVLVGAPVEHRLTTSHSARWWARVRGPGVGPHRSAGPQAVADPEPTPVPPRGGTHDSKAAG